MVGLLRTRNAKLSHPIRERERDRMKMADCCIVYTYSVDKRMYFRCRMMNGIDQMMKFGLPFFRELIFGNLRSRPSYRGTDPHVF